MDAAEQATREIAPVILDDIKFAVGDAYPPASEPGQFPHRRSGRLQSSFVYKVEKLPAGWEALFASTCPYFKFLEHGTTRMAARPVIAQVKRRWLGVYKERVKDRIKEIRSNG